MKKIYVMLALCLFITGQLFAQNKTLTGRVTDESGLPLAGATVSAVGNKANAVTEITGNFSITIPSTTKAVDVSFVGYNTLRVSISGATTLNVSLKSASTALEGVVVTGYGRQKRSTYSGAAARIDKKAIELVPMASFDQLLQGRSPGLLVTSGSGQPGASARVQLRGATSISGGSTPLFVVDGIPVEQSIFQGINPNDIEGIDVLKDATAAALYGSRGAAGVIVVTTKRGRGKTVLTYRGQAGNTEAAGDRFEMMNTDEILAFQEKLGPFIANNLPGWAYSKLNPTYSQVTSQERARRDALLDSFRNNRTNWRDIFFRRGHFTSHDLNISGGSDKTKYFASGGLYDETGIGLGSDLKRYTFRLNMDHATDKLTFAMNSSFGYTKRNFVTQENAINLYNPFAAVYLAVPYDRPYNANGTIAASAGKIGPETFASVEDIQSSSNQMKADVSANINYNFTKSIYAGGQVGVDFRETNAVTVLKPQTYTARAQTGKDTTGTYTETVARNFILQSRAFVGFRKTFNTRHTVDVSANIEWIDTKTKTLGFTGYGLKPKLPIGPAQITQGTVDNQLIPTLTGGNTHEALFSQLLLSKYSYDEKYTVDFSIRRDGHSLLPIKNRNQIFWAVGGNWNIIKENFAAKWNKVNTLRLRASYGSSANALGFPQAQGAFYANYGIGTYAAQPIIAATTPGNPELDWEYTKQLNIGLDFGFFGDRLNGSLDVYNKITENLFSSQYLPRASGFPGLQDINSGKVRNRGIELGLNYDIIRSRSVVWNIGANLAYNKNEVLDLGQVNEFELGTSIIREGLPIGSHYVVKWGGVDAATGSPLYYTLDGKLTTQYSDSYKQATFGTYNAPFIGGFNTSVRVKGFEVSALFNFQQGFSRYNNQDFFQLNHAFALQGFNVRREMLTMWTKPGDVTDIQSPLTTRQSDLSKDIQDASFLRFRNLTASYTFPKSILSKQRHITNVRVFGQAQNLFTWTKWSGFDPEDDDNIAQYEYPSPRIFTVGLELSF